MKIAGQICVACLALALLQSVAAGVMALCLLTFLYGAIFRTRETLATIGMLMLLGLVGSHPLACIIVAGLAFVAAKHGRTDGGNAADTGGATPPPLLPGRARDADGGDFGGGDG